MFHSSILDSFWYFGFVSVSLGTLKLHCIFYFLLLLMSIQMLQWRQVVLIQHLKHNSYDDIEIDNYDILNTLQNIHFGEYSIFV